MRARLTLWRVRIHLQQRLRPRPVTLTVFVAGMQRPGTHLLMDVSVPRREVEGVAPAVATLCDDRLARVIEVAAR